MTVYRRPDPIPLRRPQAVAAAKSLQAVRDQPEDLHHLVARQIFAAIASGVFAEGSILPNEHALGRDLGVSRTALREAIKGLASKGLVETRRRRGTQVLEKSRWNMLDAEVMAWSRRAGRSDLISEQLWQVIVLTQPPLARLAAERRSTARLHGPARQVQDREQAAAAIAQFHLEMARTSANPFLISLTATCLDNLLRDDPEFLAAIAARPGDGYSKLVDLIAAGRGVEAETAMRGLLEGASVPA